MSDLFDAQRLALTMESQASQKQVLEPSRPVRVGTETGSQVRSTSTLVRHILTLDAGSLQNRLLIYAHSKTLLRDALFNDTNFLATSGNIDYSLLVGVDGQSLLSSQRRRD